MTGEKSWIINPLQSGQNKAYLILGKHYHSRSLVRDRVTLKSIYVFENEP